MIEEWRARNANLEVRPRLRQLCNVVLIRMLDACNVVGLIAGHHVEQECRVLCCSSQRPAMSKQRSIGQDALQGHQPIGWLESNHPAPRGWHSHRTGRVRTQRSKTEIRCDGNRRSARRSTRIPVNIPRIASRSKITWSEGKLRHVRLADENCACGAQPPYDCGIGFGNITIHDRASKCRSYPCSRHVVLDRNWDTMKRPAQFAALLFLVQDASLFHGPGAQYRNESIQLGVVDFNPRQASF